MTIALDYTLDPSWKRDWEQLDLSSVDESTLHYNCFLGDVAFMVNGISFGTKRGWVPVLDFALCLRESVRALTNGDHATFEFTESGDTIEFTRHNDEIDVESSYTAPRAQTSYVELSREVERFVVRVLDELQEAYPELRDNPLIQDLARGDGS
jgi:hypothetical protein